jgi:palmitoyltransferase
MSRLYTGLLSTRISGHAGESGVSFVSWVRPRSFKLTPHASRTRWLLEHGAEVDPIGGDLRATPLQWAARSGHLYIIHLLLRHSADPLIQDSQGFNTLHLVTHSSVVMALLYMLHQPVAVDEKDRDGHTSLMWAAWQGENVARKAEPSTPHG